MGVFGSVSRQPQYPDADNRLQGCWFKGMKTTAGLFQQQQHRGS